MKKFRTHTGEIVSESTLSDALNAVADAHALNAYGIRHEDEYADHVTEEQKDKNFLEAIRTAEEIRVGKYLHTFWCWQRVNYELTGASVPFLPNKEA
jgi:hypothetical protein